MIDRELDNLKTAIDLRAYAAGMGYILDAKESWKGSSVMRHPDGDKVIIKRDADGHYVYFSVHREGDSGSIVDFIQNRSRGLNIGHVKKQLREWSGRPSASHAVFPALVKSSKDRIGVEQRFARMKDATRHPYLENERKIPPMVLELPRFAGRICMDERGNAVFPHFDREGLSGYEIKNKGYTGFSSGGAKGLWLSVEEPQDLRLVVCESAIDALSYHTLSPAPETRYASIGGQMNPVQPELIRSAVTRMATGAEIVSAMDADAEGQKLAEVVRKAVELSGRSDLRFVLAEPEGAKDWNDKLRGTRLASSPYRSLEGVKPSM